MATTRSPTASDGEMNTRLRFVCVCCSGEDVTSHSSDTAPDSMAEELPMDSEQTEPSTGISDGAEAVPTEPQPTISEETEAKVPASSTTITAAVVGESHTEGSAEAGPTVSEIIARAVQHEAMSGPSTTATGTLHSTIHIGTLKSNDYLLPQSNDTW